MIMGMQHDYTKYGCFLCGWDSHDRNSHYVGQDTFGLNVIEKLEKKIVYEKLVAGEDVLLFSLHINCPNYLSNELL